MALSGRRQGRYRVAGGFTWTASRVSVIATLRPEQIGWGVDREPDASGYRGLRLGRLQVLLAHDLGPPRPGQRWRRVRDGARRPAALDADGGAADADVDAVMFPPSASRPSVAERLAPYTHWPRP